MMTPEQKEKMQNLLKLGEKLRTVPPEKFDMSNWKCGTAACAIGWCPTLVPEAGITIEKRFFASAYPVFAGIYHWEAVEEAFGLDAEEAKELFSEDAYHNDWEPITPERVADRIISHAKYHLENWSE